MSEYGLDTFFVRRCRAVAELAREIARDELVLAQHVRTDLAGMQDWLATPAADRDLLLDCVAGSVAERRRKLAEEVGLLAAYPAHCLAGVLAKGEVMKALCLLRGTPDTVAMIADLGLSSVRDVAAGTARVDPKPLSPAVQEFVDELAAEQRAEPAPAPLPAGGTTLH